MKISVVIPSAGATDYLGRPYLEEALRAIRVASEVIVVVSDEEMTDAGWQLIERSDCKILRLAGEFNFSRAINAGVELSGHERILILNDDVVLPRDGDERWLERLARKRADVKGIHLLDSGEMTIQHAGIWFDGPGGLPCHKGWRRPAGISYPDGDVLGVTAATMMTSRSVFRELGGFDENLPLDYNDADYCLRARAAGYRVAIYNSIVLCHHEAATRTENPQPIKAFRLLTERHGATLAQEGITLNPDEASARLSPRLAV